jgi:hypothetical protein
MKKTIRKSRPAQNRKLNRTVSAEQDHHKAMCLASIGKRKTDVELLASRWKGALARMTKPGEAPRPIPNFELHKQSLEDLRAATAHFICHAMQSWDFERIIALGRAMIDLDRSKHFTPDFPTIYLLRAKEKGEVVNLPQLKKQAEENGSPVYSLKTWERRAKQIGANRVSPGRPNKDR